jgi:Fe-S cluster assembly protein SufD
VQITKFAEFFTITRYMSNLTHTRLEENYRASSSAQGALAAFNDKSWADFQAFGIPPVKHEEWKYVRVSSLFRDDLQFSASIPTVTAADIDAHRLPGHETATELVFINGHYSPSLSVVRHQASALKILGLREAAAGTDATFIAQHLGHSAGYHKDGIQALNGAFAGDGVFIRAHRGQQIAQPVYIYLISDSRAGFIFSQPRSLVHVEAGASVQIAEHYITLGSQESFTNEVFELVAEQDALVDYYKIQHEGSTANHVGTTHIRQIGKCVTNAVTISLSGALVRNNLNMIMEAEHGESHMYGLSLLNGKSLVDNHTIVDNVKPHCFSNELYKAIMDEESTGVFNGKIFVRKDAQKTNAYQSNKNILVGERSSANTKPQLEIFADDVKCSHGCTIGRLDEESLFYLRARGLSEQNARSLLLHAFAVDILDKIKWEPLRQHVDGLISERLQFEI